MFDISMKEKLRYFTIRLRVKRDDGTESFGTGSIFFSKVPGLEGYDAVLITNRHVAEDGNEFTFSFAPGDPTSRFPEIPGFSPFPSSTRPIDGKPSESHVANIKHLWEFHPNPNVDIAVLLFTPILHAIAAGDEAVYFEGISQEAIPDFKSEELSNIEEVYVVGYPNALIDDERLTPIVRKGVTATPLREDYRRMPHFLIDIPIFPGSSGSPVFLLKESLSIENGLAIIEEKFHFLGLVSSVHFRKSKGKILSLPRPIEFEHDEMIDLGVVVKAHCILETIEEAIKKQRRKLSK